MSTVEDGLQAYQAENGVTWRSRARRFRALSQAVAKLGVEGVATRAPRELEEKESRLARLERRVERFAGVQKVVVPSGVAVLFALAASFFVVSPSSVVSELVLIVPIVMTAGILAVLLVGDLVEAIRASLHNKWIAGMWQLKAEVIGPESLRKDFALYLGLLNQLADVASTLLEACGVEDLAPEIQDLQWQAALSLKESASIPHATGYLAALDRLLQIRSEALTLLAEIRGGRLDESVELSEVLASVSASHTSLRRLEERVEAQTAGRLVE